MPVEVELLTTSWRTVHDLLKQRQPRELGFMPVRASLGSPKFWPEAKVLPYIAELAPAGLAGLVDAPVLLGEVVAPVVVEVAVCSDRS